MFGAASQTDQVASNIEVCCALRTGQDVPRDICGTSPLYMGKEGHVEIHQQACRKGIAESPAELDGNIMLRLALPTLHWLKREATTSTALIMRQLAGQKRLIQPGALNCAGIAVLALLAQCGAGFCSNSGARESCKGQENVSAPNLRFQYRFSGPLSL